MSQIIVYRNGQPFVGSPVSTTFNHRIHFDTLEALDYLDKGGQGITPITLFYYFTGQWLFYGTHYFTGQWFQSHSFSFWLNFSTREFSWFHSSRISNCSISIQLIFDGLLAANVEICFLGEKSSTLYVNFERKVTKNNYHLPHRRTVMKYAVCWEIVIIWNFLWRFCRKQFPKANKRRRL